MSADLEARSAVVMYWRRRLGWIRTDTEVGRMLARVVRERIADAERELLR